MSRTIDERIVQMRFDNKDFESNISQSMNTLDKFDQQLNKFSGDKEAFSGLSIAITDVGKSFNWLEEIAKGALQRIGHHITDFITDKLGDLKNTINSLSFDQIGEGFDKYTSKMEVTQTIMGATRESFMEMMDGQYDMEKHLQYVNEQLEKIYWFTDETSYNASDMIANIGKFTTVGVDLETAANAMMGIANWGSSAGANVQELSRAMYNVSQALANGSMLAIDWKSIQNAGMATIEFKQIAADAALLAGTLEDLGDGLYKVVGEDDIYTLNQLFGQGLGKHWLDADTMLTAFANYGDFTSMLYEFSDMMATAGFEMVADQLELIEDWKAGNVTKNIKDLAEQFEITEAEAQDLATALEILSDDYYDLGRRAFMAGQEYRTFKDALDATKDAASTSWATIFELIFGDLLEAKKLWSEFGGFLWDVFVSPLKTLIGEIDESDPMKSTGLKAWVKAGGRKDLFDGIVNSLEAVGNAVESVYSIFYDEFFSGLIEDGASGLVGITSAFKNWSESILEASKHLEWLEGITHGFVGILQSIGGLFSSLHGVLFGAGGIFEGLGSQILYAAGAFGEWLYEVLPRKEQFDQFFKDVGDDIKGFITILDQFMERFFGVNFQQIGNGIMTAFGAIGLAFQNLFNIINTEGIGGIVTRLQPYFKKFGDVVDSFLQVFLGTNLAEIADKLTPVTEAFKNIVTILQDGNISDLLSYIGEGFEKLKNKINDFLGENFGVSLEQLFDPIEKRFKKVKDLIEELAYSFDAGGFTLLFSTVKRKLSSVFGKKDQENGPFAFIKDLGSLFTDTIDFTSAEGWSARLTNLFKGLNAVLGVVADALGVTLYTIGGIVGKIIDVIKSLFNKTKKETGDKEEGSKLADWLANFFSGFQGLDFEGFLDKVYEIVKKLIRIQTLIAEAKLVDGIAKFFSGLGGVMKNSASILRKIRRLLNGVADIMDEYEGLLKAKAFEAFAEAIKSIAISIALLAFLKPEKAFQGVTALVVSVAIMFALFKSLDKTSFNVTGLALLFISLAASLLIIAAAIKKISKIENVRTSIGAISVLLGELTGAAILISHFGKGIRASIESLKQLAKVIIALTLAVAVFSWLDGANDEAFQNGVMAVIGLIATLVAALVFMPKGAEIVQGAKALLAMAAAVDLLVIGVAIFTALAALNFDAMNTALECIVSLIFTLGLVIALLGKYGGESTVGAGALIAMAVAIDLLAVALIALSLVPFPQLQDSLIAVGLAMLAMVAAVVGLSFISGPILAAAAAMVVMAIALNLVVIAMDLGIIGIIALVGAMALFSPMAPQLEEFIPILYELARVVLAFSLAGTALAAVLVLLGAGFAIFSALVAVSIAVVTPLIFGLSTALLTLGLAMQVVYGIVAGIVGGLSSQNDLIEAGMNKLGDTLLFSLMKKLLISSPSQLFADEVGSNITLGILEGMEGEDSAINETISSLLGGMENIASLENVNFETVGSDLATSLAGGFDLSSLGLDTSITSLLNGGELTALGFEDNFGSIGDILGTDLSTGLLDTENLLNFDVTSLMDSGVFTAMGFEDDFFNVGDLLGTSTSTALGEKRPVMQQTMTEVLEGTVATGESFKERFKALGSNLGQGLLNGLKSMASAVWQAGGELVGIIGDAIRTRGQINSPSRLTYWYGEMFNAGLVEGIIGNLDQIENAGFTMVDTMQDAIYRATEAMDDDLTMTPTIRPVVDLSDVVAGSSRMNGLMTQSGMYTAGFNNFGIGSINPNSRMLDAINGLSATSSVSSPINIYVTGGANASAEEIADEVMRRLDREVQRGKAAFA